MSEFWKGDPARGARKLKALGGQIKAATATAMQRLGPQLVATAGEVMRAAQPPLHPFTVERKGSSTPLAGGELEASLTFRVEKGARGVSVWFGVPASAGELLRIAHVQEYGITIDVTPSMRAYLHAEGLHLAAETTTVVIPPRPFIAPTLARVREGRGVQVALREALRGVARS